MKKIYNQTRNFVLIAMLVTVLGSCKKSFLEILPKGKVIATKTADYDLLLNQLDLINIPATSQVLLGDEISFIEPGWTGATYKEKQLFKWEGDLYNSDEDASETLIPTRNLYVYNKIINEVMDATEGTEVNKKSIQAEAYAGRAWTNFLLIQYFGKPYNPATAATDLGFPLITEADINGKNFTRSSVQQIYDQIISDLTTAIPNIISDGVPFRSRMSKAAAQGILAKVYVFMGRHAEALPLLDESIANLAKSIVITNVVNYNTSFQGSPTTVNDLENVYSKNMSYGYAGASNRLIWLTPEAASLFGPTDTRLIRQFLVTTYPNGLKLYKRTNTLSYNIGLKVPELYLLRAEVKTRLDDLSGAVADLVYLRQNRMPAADAGVPVLTAAAKMPLLQFVMEERIREFAVTGYRWFDMRRLSVDPLFTIPVYQHKVYNVDGVVSETYNFKPERFVFKFSPKVLAENPTLQDNL
ncbi:RagB/SusD family nutrient uptake outer membrane protein [Pedobacter psychroterrae]|nr:RagB/SusD family nutrient uptake outer membrane protein [Pedobacter psychroterrae]